MTSERPLLPISTLEHGKRLIDATLELEPNLRVRAEIANQLGEHAKIRARQLKAAALIRPSQSLLAVTEEPIDPSKGQR